MLDSVVASVATDTTPTDHRVRAGLTFVGVAGVVLVLRVLGVIDGPAAVVFAGVVALAVPVSRQLSRRILVVGLLAFGWVPVLWWVPVPTAGLGRVSVLLAASAGAVAAWITLADHPAERLRRLVPHVAAVDALPALASAAAAVVLRGWFSFRSADVALAYLARGWDNSAHFDMVEMIRTHGTTIDTLAAPAGTTWKFADYPQSFHVAVAALMELTGKAVPADIGTELVAYTHAVGLVAVIGVAVVVAGLCALPSLRARPLLAAPLAVVITTGYVLGPGSIALHYGFPNFFLACVLVGAGFLLAVPLRTRVPTTHLAALGGAVVAAAHSWILLATLVAPVAVMALAIVWRGRRRRTRRALLLDAGIVLATLAATARTWAILAGLRATDVLTTQGGIPAPRLAVVLAPPIIACLGWVALSAGRRFPRTTRLTARSLAFVPMTGLLTLEVVAGVQLRRAGDLSYDFWKYGLGVELVSVVVLVAGVAAVARPWPHSRSSRVGLRVAASIAACAVATQTFGLFGPGFSRFPIWHVAPGAESYLQIAQQSPATIAEARRLLRTASYQNASPGTTLVYLETGASAIDPISAQQWLLALTTRWTSAANAQASLLLFTRSTPQAMLLTAEKVLEQDPASQLAVTGDAAPALVASLGEPTRAFVLPAS